MSANVGLCLVSRLGGPNGPPATHLWPPTATNWEALLRAKPKNRAERALPLWTPGPTADHRSRVPAEFVHGRWLVGVWVANSGRNVCGRCTDRNQAREWRGLVNFMARNRQSIRTYPRLLAVKGT